MGQVRVEEGHRGLSELRFTKKGPVIEVIGMQMFDSDFDYKGDFIDRWNSRIKQAKAAMGVLGALLVVAGVFSAVAPYSLYSFIQVLAGVALFVHGGVQVISYFGTPEFFRSSALIVSGILNALLGIMFLLLPVYLTASTLVFLLAFLFILTGFERISFARQMKYFGLPNSTAGTVTGVINVILGVMFIAMPLYSSLVLGYVLAAYLVIAGITLLVEAVSMKRIDR